MELRVRFDMFYPPPSLYDLSLKALVDNRHYLYNREFRLLPNRTLFDFYMKLFQGRCLCFLSTELGDLEVMRKLLYVKDKAHSLIEWFQAVLDHNKDIFSRLFRQFCKCIDNKHDMCLTQSGLEIAELGLKIASFFNDCGCYDYSIQFLDASEHYLIPGDEISDKALPHLLEYCRLKLHAATMYGMFTEAKITYKKCLGVMHKLMPKSPSILAAVYCEISIYHFAFSNFDESYKWVMTAFELLATGLERRMVVEILSQTSKVCVMKRKFMQSGLLIRQALKLGNLMNLDKHLPTFADVATDYAFFMHISDKHSESVKAYRYALAQRQQLLRNNNILVALAHQNLAYALYVACYREGNFEEALNEITKCQKILGKFLHRHNYLWAPADRIQALLIEEIAVVAQINNIDAQFKLSMSEAKALHQRALMLGLANFGEKNLQTAKYYGNLGRLYQSTREYEKAEEMHLKAIAIKEELLGPNDYEVGLSIGHLASLYQYNMKKYKEAEALHLRSIEINLRLFGLVFSELEYDYEGLIELYHKLGEAEMVIFFENRRRELLELRRQQEAVREDMEELKTPKQIIRLFKKLGEREEQLVRERELLVEDFRKGMETAKSL